VKQAKINLQEKVQAMVPVPVQVPTVSNHLQEPEFRPQRFV
jgi:hypothetical protein